MTSEDLLIDKGAKIDATTYRGIEINGIDYVGAAPDLGAYEYDGEISSVQLVQQESQDKSVSLFQAQNGLLFVTVNTAATGSDFSLELFDVTGKLLGQHAFYGATTAIRLPATANGIIVVKVKGANGFVGSTKAVVK